MIPTLIFQMWLLGLLAFGIIGGAWYLGHEWQQRSWSWDPVLQQSVFTPNLGANTETAMLAGAVLLVLAALMGKTVMKWGLKLATREPAPGEMDPREDAQPAAHQRLRRHDGSELQVEFYGPENGTPLIVSHGWGLDSDEWTYLKREVADRYRLVTWDEPGLGRSTRHADRDYSLENLARDLEAVLSLVNKPAVLLGHSIGGMIILTFCRLFPAALGSRVSGLVLTHTTPTNPVRTTAGGGFLTAIEKPILIPLLYLTIALSPLVWLMNWLGYRNGSAHLMTKRSSFGGTETWPQIDFAARFQMQASPAVLARGMLGMIRYDARDVLRDIQVPALIVSGDRDRVTKPEASEAMQAAMPRARLVKLAPARHLGLIEHHQRYAQELQDFVHAAQPA